MSFGGQDTWEERHDERESWDVVPCRELAKSKR